MYSFDLRRLAFIKLQQSGGRVRHTARLLEVSPSTISRWVRNSSWNIRGQRKKRKPNVCTDDMCKRLECFYADSKNHGVSLAFFHRRTRIDASLSSLRRCLKVICLSRKRLSNKVLGQMQSVKVIEYNDYRNKHVHPGTLVVSIDECNFSEKVLPLYGYSPIGEACKIRCHKGSWVNRSLVLALASDGSRYHQIKDGSVKRVDFEKFVVDMPFPRGTVLILDNCTIHKKTRSCICFEGLRADVSSTLRSTVSTCRIGICKNQRSLQAAVAMEQRRCPKYREEPRNPSPQ